jgi:hypothetical protein
MMKNKNKNFLPKQTAKLNEKGSGSDMWSMKRGTALVLQNGAVSPFPFVGGFSREKSWAFTGFHYKKRKARKKECLSSSVL